MLSLRSIICNCFSGEAIPNTAPRNFRPSRKSIWITIPTDKEEFEVPVFALYGLTHIIEKSEIGSLVVEMQVFSNSPTYATLHSNVRCALSRRYGNTLARINLQDCPNNPYYGTFGVLFDKDLNPIMTLCWKVKRVEVGQSKSIKFIPVSPIIRIHSKVAQRSNPMEKYIFNRILKEGLVLTNLRSPSVTGIEWVATIFHVQAIIDEIPFTISYPTTPSGATTNKELIDTALQYIDEVIQI